MEVSSTGARPLNGGFLDDGYEGGRGVIEGGAGPVSEAARGERPMLEEGGVARKTTGVGGVNPDIEEPSSDISV